MKLAVEIPDHIKQLATLGRSTSWHNWELSSRLVERQVTLFLYCDGMRVDLSLCIETLLRSSAAGPNIVQGGYYLDSKNQFKLNHYSMLQNNV